MCIERERYRERDTCVYVYIYIYIYMSQARVALTEFSLSLSPVPKRKGGRVGNDFISHNMLLNQQQTRAPTGACGDEDRVHQVCMYVCMYN